MKWIKASDRKPKQEGLYHCKSYRRKCLLSKEEIDYASSGHLNEIEWLDESEGTIGDVDAEIERLKGIISKKDEAIKMYQSIKSKS